MFIDFNYCLHCSENVAGEVQRVNFGPTRGSQFCVSIEQANDWYKAMNYFVDLMHHPRNVVELKMEQGMAMEYEFGRARTKISS